MARKYFGLALYKNCEKKKINKFLHLSASNSSCLMIKSLLTVQILRRPTKRAHLTNKKGAIAFLPLFWTTIVILPSLSFTLHFYLYCLETKPHSTPTMSTAHNSVKEDNFALANIPYFFRTLWIYSYLLLYFSSISIRIWTRIWHNFDNITTHESKFKPNAYI